MHPTPFFYTDNDFAKEIGLVAVGGDLSPARLLAAYQSGIFPWYNDGEPICWWSPDPRAIFDLNRLHISRRLERTIRSGRFRLTLDADFSGVIRGCAEGRDEGTWITADMIDAYEHLHSLGRAHSVECWHRQKLVGGIYGVAIGGFFAGESMFHRESDASKVALAHLTQLLRNSGFHLFDTQFLTDHTARMGAIEIPRAVYLDRLAKALRYPAVLRSG
jgi:leucyl/phenylalanyl-tRNA--protein transferase